MKYFNLFLVLLSIFFLLSCSSGSVIQLYKMKGVGEEISENNDKGILCFENDTLSICYSFWSNNGKIYFEIFNKTDNDIYLDLSRSNLILDSKRIPYWENVVTTSENGIYRGRNSSYLFPNTNTVIGSSSAIVSSQKTTYIPEKIIFLPSKTVFSFEKTVRLANFNFVADFDLLNPIYNGNKISGYTQVFSSESTPQIFRNTLAYSFNEDLKPLLKVDNSFFIEEIETSSKKFYDDFLLSDSWPGNHKRYYQYFKNFSWDSVRNQVKYYESKSGVDLKRYLNILQVSVSDSVQFEINNLRYTGTVLEVIDDIKVKLKVFTPNNNNIVEEIEYYKLRKFIKN